MELKTLMAYWALTITTSLLGCSSVTANNILSNGIETKANTNLVEPSFVRFKELQSIYVSSSVLTHRVFGELFFVSLVRETNHVLEMVKHVEVRSRSAYSPLEPLALENEPCGLSAINPSEKLPVTHLATINGRAYELARLPTKPLTRCYAAVQSRKFIGLIVEMVDEKSGLARIQKQDNLKNAMATLGRSHDVQQTLLRPTYVVLDSSNEDWVDIKITSGEDKGSIAQTHRLHRSESVLCGGGCLLSYVGLTSNGHGFVFRGADYE